jgi:hypothetical protein
MAADTELQLGHNGGPELDPKLEDDDPTGRLLFVKWAWTRAHDAAWKTPPLDILRFRVSRAQAAGLTYREYMLRLLDTGSYPQAEPAKPKRPLAKPGAPDHALRGTGPTAAAPRNQATLAQATPGPAAKTASAKASSVDSRVADARKPSPMAVGGLRKLHK